MSLSIVYSSNSLVQLNINVVSRFLTYYHLYCFGNDSSREFLYYSHFIHAPFTPFKASVFHKRNCYFGEKEETLLASPSLLDM